MSVRGLSVQDAFRGVDEEGTGRRTPSCRKRYRKTRKGIIARPSRVIREKSIKSAQDIGGDRYVLE